MQISLKFDSNYDKHEDILQAISKLLGKENVEVKKATSISDARKALRNLAQMGKVELAQELVNKYCGGSIEGAPEDSYKKLVIEIESIIEKGE
jgi:hypothetical protein